MIVVDASAVVAALVGDGHSRATIDHQHLHTPHIVDAELANALRRLAHTGAISAKQGWRALETWSAVAATRYPLLGLLARVWELRDNLSAYDGAYVALAEALDCPLVTADARISRAPGLRCCVIVVPR